MAGITKQLGIAVSDADAGRITREHLLEILQEAIDNGDMLLEDNAPYVVTTIMPLLEAGVLRSSRHVQTFEVRMDAMAKDWLNDRREVHASAGSGDGYAPTDVAALANAAGAVLHEYLLIHDDLFGGGILRTMRRFLPLPGFFQAIDFEQHTARLKELQVELVEVDGRLAHMAHGSRLATILKRYCAALSEALARLEYITARLATRRHDAASYSRAAYEEDVQVYQAAILEYVAIGESVNRGFRSPLS